MPQTGGLDQVGIELIAANEANFRRSVDGANQSYKKFTDSLQGSQATLQSTLLKATALGNVIGTYLTRAFDQSVAVMKKFTTESVQIAGRFQQLQEVVYLQAEKQGKSRAEMDRMITTIRKYGIEASEAANQIIQFTRYELNLADATKLARVAQDAAVLTGSNSSETLQRLMWGIQTYNTEIFRTAGIMIRTDEAFKKYAATLGVTVEQMTSAQRSQAIMNAVLEEGSKVSGAYERSLTTPAKILSSLPRIINDIQVAMGTPFLSGWAKFLRALYDGGQAVTKLLEPGGKLYPLIMELGGAFNAVGVIFSNFAKNNLQDIANWIANAGKMFVDFATAAISYGANFIAQFATGFINAINSFIIPAVEALANILTFWLAPGSPPKFLPDLDKWGAGAMMAYLHGMTEADFSALSSLQGIFSSALSGLGLENADDLLKDLSAGLMEALTGGSTAEFLNQVKNSLGAYGQEVAELVDLQLKLAAANEAVLAAEKALKDARKEESTAQKNLSKIIKEYNDLAAGGASKEVLDAKRKEYEAAKAARDQAKQARKTAEENYKTASEGNDTLTEQVSLQQKVVEQLIKMTSVQKELKAAGAGKAGGVSVPAVKPPQVGQTGGETLGESHMEPWEQSEADKKMFVLTMKWKKMFEDAFKPITDLGVAGGPIDKLKTAFETLDATVQKINLKPVSDALESISKSPVIATIVEIATKFLIIWGIAKLLTPVILGIGKAIAFLGTLKSIGSISVLLVRLAAGFGSLIALLGGPVTVAIMAVIALAALVISNWEAVSKWFSQAWTDISAWATKAWGEIKTGASQTWENIKKWGSDAGEFIKGIWGGVTGWFKQQWDTFKSDTATAWDYYKTQASETWEKFKTIVSDAVGKVKEKLVEIFGQEFVDGMIEKWEGFKNALNTIFTFIKDKIAGPVINTIKGWIGDLMKFIDDVKKALSGLTSQGNTIPSGYGSGGTFNWSPGSTNNKIPKAAGGPVVATGSYLVGERGPEMFVPDSNGRILSNSALTEMIDALTTSINMLTRATRVAQVAKTAIIPALSGSGGGRSTAYNLTLNTNMTARTVRQGFELMRVLGG